MRITQSCAWPAVFQKIGWRWCTYAAEVLHRLLKEFKPADIAISSYGIREGMLYEVMPDDMRAADPLLAACRFVEEKDARVPGFGDRLV